MTKLLDEAVEAVRLLPADDQDDIARAIMQLAGSDIAAPVVLSDEEREALADLTSILDFIADRTPQGAARVQTRIRAVTDLLLRYPLAGAVTDDPTIRRNTTTPPPLNFYKATDGEITIHAVDPAREPSGKVRSE